MKAETVSIIFAIVLSGSCNKISIWVSFLLHNAFRDRENQIVTGLG